MFSSQRAQSQRETTCWGGGEGLKKKKKATCVQSSVEAIFTPYPSFFSHKIKFTWPSSSWVLALTSPSPWVRSFPGHGWPRPALLSEIPLLLSYSARHTSSQGLCSVSVQAPWQVLQSPFATRAKCHGLVYQGQNDWALPTAGMWVSLGNVSTTAGCHPTRSEKKGSLLICTPK